MKICIILFIFWGVLSCSTSRTDINHHVGSKNKCIDYHYYKGKNKELVLIGNFHTHGTSELSNYFDFLISQFIPSAMVLHRVGTRESLEFSLQKTPQKYWEESDFLINQAVKNNIPIAALSPSLKDQTLIKQYHSKYVDDPIMINTVRIVYADMWISKNDLKTISLEKLRDQSIIKKFGPKSWIRRIGLWNYINGYLETNYPKKDYKNAIILVLDDYAKKQGSKNFISMVITEGSLKKEPYIMAPFVVRKDAIGKLNDLHSKMVNKDEVKSIIEMLSIYPKVFAQSGRTHVRTYLRQLDKILKEKYQMKAASFPFDKYLECR